MTTGWTTEQLQSGLTAGRGFWATFHYPAGAQPSDGERQEDLRALAERIRERWPGVGIGIQIDAGAEYRLRVQFLPPPGESPAAGDLRAAMQDLWSEVVPRGVATVKQRRDPE